MLTLNEGIVISLILVFILGGFIVYFKTAKDSKKIKRLSFSLLITTVLTLSVFACMLSVHILSEKEVTTLDLGIVEEYSKVEVLSFEREDSKFVIVFIDEKLEERCITAKHAAVVEENPNGETKVELRKFAVYQKSPIGLEEQVDGMFM